MGHSFHQIVPTDHFSVHEAYLPVYEKLFRPLKETKDCILEFGCASGGSILTYADYFKESRLVSCDIAPRPKCIDLCKRITYLQVDAYSKLGMEEALKHAPFAVAIDDGPHSVESQRIFCANIPHYLSPNGIAIVEDCQSIDYIVALAPIVPEGFFTMAIDLRHHGRYDNILFCIWRKSEVL